MHVCGSCEEKVASAGVRIFHAFRRIRSGSESGVSLRSPPRKTGFGEVPYSRIMMRLIVSACTARCAADTWSRWVVA